MVLSGGFSPWPPPASSPPTHRDATRARACAHLSARRQRHRHRQGARRGQGAHHPPDRFRKAVGRAVGRARAHLGARVRADRQRQAGVMVCLGATLKVGAARARERAGDRRRRPRPQVRRQLQAARDARRQARRGDRREPRGCRRRLLPQRLADWADGQGAGARLRAWPLCGGRLPRTAALVAPRSQGALALKVPSCVASSPAHATLRAPLYAPSPCPARPSTRVVVSARSRSAPHSPRRACARARLRPRRRWLRPTCTWPSASAARSSTSPG